MSNSRPRAKPTRPRDQAGLRETTQGYDGRVALGDIITAVDIQPVKSLDELYHALDGKQIGDTIQLEIQRDGAKKTLAIKLEAQPGADSEPERPRAAPTQGRRANKY